MKNKRLFKYFAGVLIIFIIFPVIFNIKAANADESKKIRVAYPIQPGITDIDENGNYSGYTYEYLQEVAQYTGWEYEFVKLTGTVDEQLTQYMDMLKKGEIDLMGAMLYTDDIAKEYDVCGYNYGTVETVLQVPADNWRNINTDVSRNKNIRVGALSKNGRLASDFNDYCRINNVTPEIIQYKDIDDMIDAFNNNEIDAILNTSMNYFDKLHTIVGFSPRQFYFITTKNKNAELVDKMKEAITEINQANPYFQSALSGKYFTPHIYNLNLTDDEINYINQNNILKVGVLRNRPPFQYKDETTGQLKGVGAELLRNIAQKTGLKFKYVEVDSTKQLYNMMLTGEIDMLAGMPYNYEIAAKYKLSMTQPYAESQYILLLNEKISENNIKGKRLAMSRDSTYDGYYLGKVEYYDSIDDCIRAVYKGDADYTYADSYTVQYYINLWQFDTLKMVPQTYTPVKMSFAINQSLDHNLFRILNKAINSMTIEEVQNIIYVNTLQKHNPTIGYFIKKNPVVTIMIVASILIFIILLLLIILYQRSASNKKTAVELNRHIQLYAISNDLIFEYNYNDKTMMLNIPNADSGGKNVINYDFKKGYDNPESVKSRDVMLELLNSNDNAVSEKRLYSILDNKWHWYRIVIEKINNETNKPIYAIGKLNLIDERRKEMDDLLNKAQLDSLTHLYNIESCEKKIAQCLLKQKKDSLSALILLDIDYFKNINDTYGHMCGDNTLRSVAKTLDDNFDNDCIIGRPGGDEFIVFIPSVNGYNYLEEKCNLLCNLLRKIKPDDNYNITVSIGAVLISDSDNYPNIYKIADDALYTSKNIGRDRFTIEISTEQVKGKTDAGD